MVYPIPTYIPYMVYRYIDISHTYPNPPLPWRSHSDASGPFLPPLRRLLPDFSMVWREMSTKFLACGMLNANVDAFWWYLVVSSIGV